MKSLEDLFRKLRIREKKRNSEIPSDSIKCSRCGKIIKKVDAVISLPEEWYVCEECYFRYAQFIAHNYFLALTPCEVCGEGLKGNWCTRNVCRECCLSLKCPQRAQCATFPTIIEREKKRFLKRVIENPSERVEW